MLAEETLINQALWRTARRSVGNGACVEVAPASAAIMVRDSTDRVGPMLRYSAPAWHAFIADTKVGSFDVVR